MRILFLDQFSDLGGAQLCLLDLLPAVEARGWKAWLAAPGDGPLLARAPVENVESLRLGSYRSREKSAGDSVRFVPDTIRVARQIREIAWRHRIELLYVNGPRVLPAATFARGALPLVYHCHSYLSRPRETSLVEWCLRRARARVIANCRYVLEAYRRLGEVSVIYNGVASADAAGQECSARQARVPAPRRPADTNTVGLIGRIGPEKGQREFVLAAGVVHRQFPKCRFVICGTPRSGDASSEQYASEVRKQADGLPIEWLGWRDNIGEVLAKLDLLVVPSSPHEATTRVIPEAFSAGVPVIATRAGGIPEIVDDGVTGFLIANTEPETVAAAILATIGKPRDELRAMGTRAREVWNERFRLEAWQERVLSVVEAAQQAPEQPSAE